MSEHPLKLPRTSDHQEYWVANELSLLESSTAATDQNVDVSYGPSYPSPKMIKGSFGGGGIIVR